jgi:FAD/FMN-containing dehydrogenase
MAWTTGVVVAESPTERSQLWSTRHAVAEAVRRQGRPHKLDLVVPLRSICEFLQVAEESVTRLRPDARAVLFGHVADGNVHVNLLGAGADDHELLDHVVALAMSHGGHASAEHGIGVTKARWLPLTRAPAELEVLEQLRALFDPQGVLNPRVFRGST